MYYQIDFGEALSFNKIEMAAGNSVNDYPRSYAIYATNDLAMLGSPIASGSGATITSIGVPVTTARYVRIVSTGSAPSNWWSIAEINVSGWASKNRTPINVPDGSSVFDIKKLQVDFGRGANKFSMRAASAGSGGEVELRLDSNPDIVIGRCFFHNTGSPKYFFDYDCESKKTVAGPQVVNMKFQDYSDPEGGKLLKVSEFKYALVEDLPASLTNRLSIYPSVPGLQASPYYEIRVNKVSELNSTNLAEVTNWISPFAFFTECPLGKEPAASVGGFYSDYIGGWSHTYTNFELDANTPIVVKISRKANNTLGAPAGPITRAAAYPVHKVESVKIINGDVYVTMKNPAQISIDIDGQMDMRDAPRVSPDGWGFPYIGRDKGSHAVSIFANPVIENKPKAGDAGVLVINAGQIMPDLSLDTSWKTLVFSPGVHNVSLEYNGGKIVERARRVSDRIPIIPGKNYYIPGDAIVYGNFKDDKDDSWVTSKAKNKDIRIFGHGTISGVKIPHFSYYKDPNDPLRLNNNGIRFTDTENSSVEGITLIDSADHNFYINGSSPNKNSLKFVKVIGWRTNSDAASISGNFLVEDSFFRVQDDGHYIGGAKPLRRIVFWHDVNGQDFRGDFALNAFGSVLDTNPPRYLEKQIVIEDIDIVYARSVFTTGADVKNGLVGLHGGSTGTTTSGGVLNTGQMIVFRNIRVSDPKPNRGIFEVDASGSYAGIRFENITYAGKQAFGWRNTLIGGAGGLRNFVFDNVSIAGEKIDFNYVNNPVNFNTNNVFDLTFRIKDIVPSTPYTLTRTAINGSIKLITSGSTVTVTATPIQGYRFIGWAGDLSGANSTATITMDRDKAITANFKLQ